MTDKYKALREAALLATPGKWRAVDAEDSFGRSYDGDTVADLCAFIVAPERNGMLKHPRCDATYMAAANPAAISKLLADRDALLEALRDLVSVQRYVRDAPIYVAALGKANEAITAATKGKS